jgi:hemolysin activation/secretion protein
MSTGDLLQYERISLEFPLVSPGWLAGAALSSLEYTLGDSAASTLSSGSANQSSVWGKYQVERSQNLNTAARLQWDHMELKDHQNADAIKTDRTINLLNLTFNLDAMTTQFGNARNLLTAGLVTGVLGFDDAVAETTDNNSAKHNGSFQKFNFQASRQQYLSQTSTLVMNIDTQWASKNLDSSQKFSIGGSRSVRAYESGALSGDGGILLSAEWRELLPPPPESFNVKGQWIFSVFADAGIVKINQQPWDNAKNEQGLSGVGWGLNWLGPDNWRGSFSMARPLEHTPTAYVGSKRMNAWFEIAKGFR